MRSIISLLVFSAIPFLFSCNSQDKAATPAEPAQAGTHAHTESKEVKEPQAVSAAFTTVDPAAAGAIHAIIGHYLDVKNALASDDGAKAAEAAGAISDALKKVDKSLLTAEQKAAFDKSADIVGQESAKIAGSAADIAGQRASFFPLSESVYALAKQFGGGKTLYHDHCPMARDNQGAMWISEQKDIRNPYFGSGMLTCGTVEEVIQ